MESKTIRLVRRGELVSLTNVPPERTLLEVLREDLGECGTKEGCGEGDCGACTVVIAEPKHGRLQYRAINSCIRLAHSVDGMALWTVEDLAAEDGTLSAWSGATSIFITPGYRFRAVDVLMTNFHLPRSTLFMLVSAFAGMEEMRAAYEHAIESGYRFYSYGDASLLFPAKGAA